MTSFAPSGPVWEEIAKIALLGTERAALAPPRGPDSPEASPLHALLQLLDANDREGALLSAAAIVAQHARVGMLPPEDARPLPEACLPEEKPAVSPRAADFLHHTLEGEFAQHLPEWLRLAAARNLRAPFELLPQLLHKGRHDAALRPLIAPLLGKRGVWLAAQNPDWKWAVGSGEIDLGNADEVWQTGLLTERAALLRLLRATEPVRARELLSEAWPQEPPEERAAFIAALEIELSMGDEAFLEAALDDKRKEVRAKAAELLASLPESRLVTRMIERVRPLLQWTPAKLLKKPHLEVELPSAHDKAMERDGIAKKPPIGGGEKTAWLVQMLTRVPPQFWCEQWQASPEVVLAAARRGDWKGPFTQAWAEASLRFGDAAMVRALLETGELDTFEWNNRTLWNLLAPPDRDVLLLARWEKAPINVASSLLLVGDFSWSEKLARAVIGRFRQLILSAEDQKKQGAQAYQLQWHAKEFACRVPPSLLHEFIMQFSDPSLSETPHWATWQHAIQQFTRQLQFRADMLAVLND